MALPRTHSTIDRAGRRIGIDEPPFPLSVPPRGATAESDSTSSSSTGSSPSPSSQVDSPDAEQGRGAGNGVKKCGKKDTAENGESVPPYAASIGKLVEFGQYLNRSGYTASDTAITDVIGFVSSFEGDKSFSSPCRGVYWDDAYGDEFDLADFSTWEPFLEPFLAKTPGEHKTFRDDFKAFVMTDGAIVASDKTRDRIRRAMDAATDAEEARIELEKNARRAREAADRARRKADKAAESEVKKPVVSERTAKRLDEKFAKLEDDYEKILGDDGASSLKGITDAMLRKTDLPDRAETNRMRSMLMKMAKRAMSMGPKAMDALELIEMQTSALGKIDKAKSDEDDNELSAAAARAECKARNLEASLALQQINEKQAKENVDGTIASIIEKEKAERHRREFDSSTAKNAVRTYGAAPCDIRDIDFDRKLEQMTESERRKLADYISDNARKFRTRVSGNVRTRSRCRIDIKETVKSACRTGGIPMRICMEKPRRNRAKLLMFLDVSGSCKKTSQMMMTFMGEMREAFPGGCETYAFVNSLHDVSDMFEDGGSDTIRTANEILSTIPSKGIYSDYHKPFSKFAGEMMSEVSKDTIVFFIGDARNNRNPTSEEDIKKIARRAKRAYWLDTDPAAKWDQGDSIIGRYAPYMDAVIETVTVGQLLTFLTNAK